MLHPSQQERLKERQPHPREPTYFYTKRRTARVMKQTDVMRDSRLRHVEVRHMWRRLKVKTVLYMPCVCLLMLNGCES